MHPIVSANSSRIADICRQFHVKRLDVFGSAARGSDFDLDHSDVDFLVEFDSDSNAGGPWRYFELKFALEAVLGRDVDLVMGDGVRNPYINATIQRFRETVYAP